MAVGHMTHLHFTLFAIFLLPFLDYDTPRRHITDVHIVFVLVFDRIPGY
jgi:hypothetical protein